MASPMFYFATGYFGLFPLFVMFLQGKGKLSCGGLWLEPFAHLFALGVCVGNNAVKIMREQRPETTVK